MFSHGLNVEKDTELRTRILTKLEQNQDVMLQQVSEECEKIVNLRYSTEKTGHIDCSQVK